MASSEDRNVEIVRRGFEAFETMDMDAFTQHWADYLVWNVAGYDGWPGAKTEYVGAPEILAEFGSFMGTVRALEVTDLQVTPLDGDRVIATYHERRINEGDTDPVHLDIGILYEHEPATGTITRIEVYTGHERARLAAHATTVRKSFEGFQRLDMDAFTAAWHPEVVWDMGGYENWPGEKRIYEGEADVITGFAGYLGSVNKLEVSGLQVTPLDDGRVLGVHLEKRTYANGDVTFLEIGTVYEFGGEAGMEITRVEVYTGHDTARAAVGLA